MLRMGPHRMLTHGCLNKPGGVSKYVLLQLLVAGRGQLRRKGFAAALRPASSAMKSRAVPVVAKAPPFKDNIDASVIGRVARQQGDAVLVLILHT